MLTSTTRNTVYTIGTKHLPEAKGLIHNTERFITTQMEKNLHVEQLCLRQKFRCMSKFCRCFLVLLYYVSVVSCSTRTDVTIESIVVEVLWP